MRKVLATVVAVGLLASVPVAASAATGRGGATSCVGVDMDNDSQHLPDAFACLIEQIKQRDYSDPTYPDGLVGIRSIKVQIPQGALWSASFLANPPAGSPYSMHVRIWSAPNCPVGSVSANWPKPVFDHTYPAGTDTTVNLNIKAVCSITMFDFP